MTDKNGLTLREGDPVMLDDEAAATVLRVVSEDRYLVQLDQRSPEASPKAQWLVDREASWEIDTQDPFEVEGDRLTFMGDLDWADDDFDLDDEGS